MITGGSGSDDTGRPAKPDLGGRKQKIKSVSIQTIKCIKSKMHSMPLKGGHVRPPKSYTKER